MGLREENVVMVKQNGTLDGAVETMQKQLTETQALLAKRNKEHEALLRQVSEVNENAINLNRESDELRYKIPQLERKIADLISHNSKLRDFNNGSPETIRDLAASLKALTQK